MSFALTKHEPPFYLLAQPLAHSSQSAANFTHPLIEYHFADDPPSNLLPGSDAESVIIIDYENTEPIPVAQSLHQDLAVAGVKVTTAPGATTARDDEPKRNDKMYIIQTLSAAAGERWVAEILMNQMWPVVELLRTAVLTTPCTSSRALSSSLRSLEKGTRFP